MRHSESQDPELDQDPEPKLKTEMLFGIRYNEYGSTTLEINKFDWFDSSK